MYSTQILAVNCNFDEYMKQEVDDNPQYGIIHISNAVSSFRIKGKNHVFFNSIPTEACKTDKFLISGDIIKGISTDGVYIKADYINYNSGIKTTGWIKTNELEQIPKELNIPNVKKILGGVGSTASGIKNYEITCENDKTYEVIHITFEDSWSIYNGDEIKIKTPSVDDFSEKFCAMTLNKQENECTTKNIENKITKINENESSFRIIGENKQRAYFYSAPFENCKTEIFVIKGDKIDGSKRYRDYINAVYINPKNNRKVEGWIEEKNIDLFERNSNNLLSSVKNYEIEIKKQSQKIEEKDDDTNYLKKDNSKFANQINWFDVKDFYLIYYFINLILFLLMCILFRFFRKKQYYGRIIGRKSWLVYFKSLLKYTILYSIIYYIHLEQKYGKIGEDINFMLYNSLIIFFLNSFFENRSYYISIFDSEVRIDSGYLPWSINCEFIYWKDIVKTMYYVNFMSWLTNSYTIVISRKNNNTYDSEINMTNIWNAAKVSGTIIHEYESRLKSTERYQVY